MIADYKKIKSFFSTNKSKALKYIKRNLLAIEILAVLPLPEDYEKS